jgi:tetratricopeptide (TPR) repeat protein
MKNYSHSEEAAKRTPKFDINKIDYGWIEKTSSLKELRLAYEELEYDGGFPDLLKTLQGRMCELDPVFKRRIELSNVKISADEERKINDDLFSFLDQMQATDDKLRGINNTEDQENDSIFGNSDPAQSQKRADDRRKRVAEEVENKNLAANERLKGNEFIKAKDFKEAIQSYSRSIELDSEEAASYSNRAMAHLKLKDYRSCLGDANKALEIKPGYLKAMHRRGKALYHLGKHDEAIEDFQIILEQEPDNIQVTNDLKDARRGQGAVTKKSDESKSQQESKEPEKKEGKKKFVRVAIEEDSEDDEEPTIEDVTSGQSDPIVSKFPLSNPKEIEAHNRDAMIKMKQGAADFQKKFEKIKQESQKQSKITVVNNPIEKTDVTATKTVERESELRQKQAEVERLAAEAKIAEQRVIEETAGVEALREKERQAQEECDKAQKEAKDAE